MADTTQQAVNSQENGTNTRNNPTDTTMNRDQTPPGGSSDGEGGERTTREKLKKTSIAGLAQHSQAKTQSTGEHPLSESITAESLDAEGAVSDLRGRPAKKRSFDELQEKDPEMEADTTVAQAPLPKSGHHKRMRSRDITSGEHLLNQNKLDNDVTSAVREESDAEAQQSPGGPGILIEAPTQAPIAQNAATEASSNTGNATTSATSRVKSGLGFANASAASPFGSFQPSSTQSKSEAQKEKDTDTKPSKNSAFSSSGISAFASSEKSPFGAASTTRSSGGFGGGSPAGGFGSSGGFGGASSFASKGSSGFGSGGGFGSNTGFGTGFGNSSRPIGGLSSFAGPAGTINTFGTAKPFGASTEDNEEDSDQDDEGDDSAARNDETHEDKRFQKQDGTYLATQETMQANGRVVKTGEEEEETVFACRAKLYHFEKEWKERGVGTLKINVRHENKALADEDEEQDIEAGESFSTTEQKARLVMRTDGVHKVILNTPVFKSMHIGDQDGEEPVGKTMHLTGLEDGKPRNFQIKVRLLEKSRCAMDADYRIDRKGRDTKAIVPQGS